MAVITVKDGNGNPITMVVTEVGGDKVPHHVMVGSDGTTLRVVKTTTDGTVHTTGPLTDTQLRATAVPVSGPLTDTQLRATAVPVSGPLTDTQLRATAVPVSGPLTDTQLRATAVPVSGPLTDTQLRATAVPVSGPLTDTQLRATAVPVSGPLTDTQLRATAVPVSGPLTDTQLRAAAVPVALSGATTGTGGVDLAGIVSASGINATVVKNAAGRVFMIAAGNIGAAPRYLKLYNKSTAPAPATDTGLLIGAPILLPAGGGQVFVSLEGFKGFTAGISFAVTAGIAAADATAINANEVTVNIGYK